MKEVETEWKWEGNDQDSEDILETSDRLNRVLTDRSTGEAKIDVYGKRRRQAIDKEPVLIPNIKKVWIHVTPQVKATNILQDLVDAGGTAAGGPLGILTFISECMFRMKVFGTENMQLLVKDWLVVRTQASVSVQLSARRQVPTTNGSLTESINRWVGFKDILMIDNSIEPPPPVDFNSIKNPETRKKIEDGHKALVEASKGKLFWGEKDGTFGFHRHDYFYSNTMVHSECGEGRGRSWLKTTADGEGEGPFKSMLAISAAAPEFHGLMVEVRTDTKEVRIAITGELKGTETFSGSGVTFESRPFKGSVFDGIVLDPSCGDSQTLVLPIQKVDEVPKKYTIWSGVCPITYKWGISRNNPGTGIASYVIIRKLLNKT